MIKTIKLLKNQITVRDVKKTVPEKYLKLIFYILFNPINHYNSNLAQISFIKKIFLKFLFLNRMTM